VETAFFRDRIPHVDASYRTIADRTGRAVAGYSMGGAGALRYALAHPEVLGASIALSPAVYVPLPPADSSTRDFGAFGKGTAPFSEATYLRLNWPAALKSFAATGLQSPLYIAVGDDEYKNPKAIDATHDLYVRRGSEVHLPLHREAAGRADEGDDHRYAGRRPGRRDRN
jgi:pimeloyl-ACP methyl ester carboxylesterase